MESTLQKQCPKCNIEVSQTAYFCSNCGKPLKSRPDNTSTPQQILVYFVSFFLAPFGLVYAFKYLREPNRKSKIIGIISLTLTVLAIIAVIYTGVAFVKHEYSAINLINSGGL